MAGRPRNIDMSRAINDFTYYAPNILKIKDKNANLVNFKLWEPQVRLHNVLEGLKTKGLLQRVIALKARQEGISTYTEGRIFHCAHFEENTKNVIISHDKDSGNSIFSMCRLFYDSLPKQLRPMTRFSSKKELVFANPDQKTRFQNPGLRSSIEVITAGKKGAARSQTIHNLHCSEVSSWPFAKDVIPGLLPTVPKNDKSLVVYESTAKGVGNFFHKEWLNAVEGVSNFFPFFLAWFDLDSYSRNFIEPGSRAAFSEHLNDEEKELLTAFDLTLEQLFWRRTEIADLGGDIELFRQEYPSTPDEAFLVSGSPIFDRRKLRMMSIKAKEPKFRGDITSRGPVPNEDGSLKVWKLPEPGAIYTIGVDVADGGEGGDYSCIEVWKKLPVPYIAEQVAEWHGHLDPYNFAVPVVKLGKMYNEALVAIEVNAHGLATQQEVQRTYWNLYQQEHLDRYTNIYQNKIGWDTTTRTKKLLISFMTHCVSDMTIIVHSAPFVRECMTFVRDETGSAAAAGSGYDDRVMAGMIGLFVMHQVINEEPTDSDEFTTMTSPISNMDRIIEEGQVRLTTDTSFLSMLEYGQDNQYEETWLNY